MPSSTIARLSWTAIGALTQIRSASASADVDRGARLAQRVDQPERVRALGGDRVAGDRELHRDVARQHPREPEQPARARDQRALDLGDAEGGGGRGDDEVARADQLAAARQRGPVDGGDQRLAAIEAGDAAEPAGLGDQAGDVAGGDLLEVGAGAEHRAAAGDDPGPQLRVALEAFDRLLQARGHHAIDRVARLRTVDGDQRDPAADLELDHPASLGRHAAPRCHRATLVPALPQTPR